MNQRNVMRHYIETNPLFCAKSPLFVEARAPNLPDRPLRYSETGFLLGEVYQPLLFWSELKLRYCNAKMNMYDMLPPPVTFASFEVRLALSLFIGESVMQWSSIKVLRKIVTIFYRRRAMHPEHIFQIVRRICNNDSIC